MQRAGEFIRHLRNKRSRLFRRCEPCGAVAPLGEPRRMSALRGPLRRHLRL